MGAEHVQNPDLLTVKKDYPGNIIVKGRFVNEYTTPFPKPTLGSVLRWKFFASKEVKERRKEKQPLQVIPLNYVDTNTNQLIWLGHASFLLVIAGKKILIDPVLGNLPIIKRKIPAPCKPQTLGDIDYLCITHSHRDHLDKKTIQQLAGKNIHALVGLGTKQLIESMNKNIHAQEAGWWQEYMLDEDFRVIYLPALHWTNRKLFDNNKYLWGSFLLITKETTIFFCGDSGYSNHYKDIREQFGPIDICVLPIGAYEPADIMRANHMGPDEAAQAFEDLGGKLFIPMHHGTFKLSDDSTQINIAAITQEFTKRKERNKLHLLTVGKPMRWVAKQ